MRRQRTSVSSVPGHSLQIPRRHALRAAVVLLLLFMPVVLPAQSQGTRPGKEVLLDGIPDLAKVSSHLLRARKLTMEGYGPSRVQQEVPLLRMRGSLAEIEIRLRGLTPSVVPQVQALGVRILGVYEDFGIIVAASRFESLAGLAAIPEVSSIHPNFRPVVMAGNVLSQADSSIRADLARSTCGVDGTGVTVGVLSDSFNTLLPGGTITGTGCTRTLSGTTPQADDDLPASVTLLDNGAGTTDEGRGMAELVHDLAPGADLSFHSAFNSLADFAAGIDELRACGADVIVDDVIYFIEPMFQDGFVAQSAAAAASAGVPYFSSAGNQANQGADEFYADSSGGTGFGQDFHDFGGGDTTARIQLPPGCQVIVVLQWNEPFDGLLGPGATTDLDLYRCTVANPAAPGDCPGSSTTLQGCSVGGTAGDPFEILLFQNPFGVTISGYFGVDRVCGAAPRFRLVAFPSCGNASFESGIFDDFTIFGHAAAAEAAAVGAVLYAEIDSGGTLTGDPAVINVEPFSSLGGQMPFYFDGAGAPLPGAPVTRFKPDIAAPDGTNTTFFGQDISLDTDTFPNFFGTSAAAPHAAAVAALLVEAKPWLTVDRLVDTMRFRGQDIEDFGRDPLSGDGLIDALDACQPGLNCVDPPPGMVLWWPGDYPADLCLPSDVTREGNHGTTVGFGECVLDSKVPDTVFGVGSLSFVSGNVHFLVPDNPSLNFGTGDFSIDAWIKDPGPSLHTLVHKFAAGSGYSLYTSGGSLAFALGTGGSSATYGPAGPSSLNDGGWHHVAVTVLRSDPGGRALKLFVDGAVVLNDPAPQLGDVGSPADLLVGGPETTPVTTAPPSGLIDELEIFNRALSDAEVQAIHAADADGKCKRDGNGNGIVDESEAVIASDGTKYCIQGTSTGIGYSWGVDTDETSLTPTFEDFNLNAPAVLPVGSSGADLAAALVTSVNSTPGPCFAAISSPTSCLTIGCSGGPPRLFVGPQGSTPACLVTVGSPCNYNPTITKVAELERIPTLSQWGLATLALLLLTAGAFLARRRRIPRAG